MKKLVFILLLSLLVFSGCSKTSGPVNKKVSVSDPVGKELLDTVKTAYKNSDSPTVVFMDVEADFNKVKDEQIKKELLKLYNDSVVKMYENNSDKQLHDFFDPNNTQDINKLAHVGFLSEETKKKLFEHLFPINTALEKQNLRMEKVASINNVIKSGTQRYDAVVWFDNNKIQYEYLNKDYSKFIYLNKTNIVLEVDEEDKIGNIFKIRDSKGNVVEPFTPLQEVDTERVAKEKETLKKIGEELDKQRQAEAAQKEVKIGMTIDEVIERIGEPERVHRTTTANGVSEQWVYNGKYLYFEDGILDTIQD